MDITTSLRPASSRRSSAFARAAVRLEFRARDAKAIEQDDFVDRQPGQLPRRLTKADTSNELALDQLAEAIWQVVDLDESSAA